MNPLTCKLRTGVCYITQKLAASASGWKTRMKDGIQGLRNINQINVKLELSQVSHISQTIECNLGNKPEQTKH